MLGLKKPLPAESNPSPVKNIQLSDATGVPSLISSAVRRQRELRQRHQRAADVNGAALTQETIRQHAPDEGRGVDKSQVGAVDRIRLPSRFRPHGRQHHADRVERQDPAHAVEAEPLPQLGEEQDEQTLGVPQQRPLRSGRVIHAVASFSTEVAVRLPGRNGRPGGRGRSAPPIRTPACAVAAYQRGRAAAKRAGGFLLLVFDFQFSVVASGHGLDSGLWWCGIRLTGEAYKPEPAALNN